MSASFGRLVRLVIIVGLLVGGTAVYLVWQRNAHPARSRPTDSPRDVAQDEGRGEPRDEARSEPQDEPILNMDSQAAAAMAAFRKLCDGKALAGEDKHAEALVVFEEVIRASPGTRYAWDAEIQAASALAGLKRYKEAQARFDRILATCRIEEIEPAAKIAKADALSLAGETESAVKLLEELMVVHAESTPLVCEDTLGTMIEVYKRTGQLGLVRAAMARIIEDYPGTEDFKGRRASRDTAELVEQVARLQQPIVARLVADKEALLVEKLAAGQNTWKAGPVPYLVTKPLTIAPDQTLKIEAGARVRFGVCGGFQVKGALEIAGTADKPVELMPLGDDPTRDWWAGIDLAGADAAGESRLTGCRIVGADVPLAVRSGKAAVEGCRIDRGGRVSLLVERNAQLTLLRSQIVGGYRQGAECERGAVLRMIDCQIVGLVTGGLILREVSDESTIKDTRIEHCGMDGIWVRGGCRPTIEGCQILGNARHGVFAIEGACPVVLNSRIRGNAAAGVRLKERWMAALRGNIISANCGGGIRAEVRCGGEIADNRIEENVGFGVKLTLDCSPSVTGNILLGNTGPGLLLQNAQPRKLEGNQFVGNSECGLRNEGTGPVQAKGNWWGSDREADVARQIQGRGVNPGWGEVEFRPWLRQAPAAPTTAAGR
ncbi:MAG TPA: right-handed parallel beta-helix repeat-containing protein [Phycisphaerae bacterium]|nr:right-handed parallel beta-helix repeat-containing protein [Phycisphaerae bacterium]HRY70301.1 right-handed parallel beta-helix repeat-containing protein [Phycisphaerae bacterium]HSA27528.1 right-handed parallel beta-helix repeat-containing protein [Phycisphaerae bacterium]